MCWCVLQWRATHSLSLCVLLRLSYVYDKRTRTEIINMISVDETANTQEYNSCWALVNVATISRFRNRQNMSSLAGRTLASQVDSVPSNQSASTYDVQCCPTNQTVLCGRTLRPSQEPEASAVGRCGRKQAVQHRAREMNTASNRGPIEFILALQNLLVIPHEIVGPGDSRLDA